MPLNGFAISRSLPSPQTPETPTRRRLIGRRWHEVERASSELKPQQLGAPRTDIQSSVEKSARESSHGTCGFRNELVKNEHWIWSANSVISHRIGGWLSFARRMNKRPATSALFTWPRSDDLTRSWSLQSADRWGRWPGANLVKDIVQHQTDSVLRFF